MTPAPKEDGSRIHFRAVCGVGWVVYQHLEELRNICDRQASGRDYFEWILLLSKELESYKPTYDAPNVWIGDMQGRLSALINGPEGRNEPEVQTLLNKISGELASPEASDIQGQLDHFNSDGYRVAGEMLNSPEWSTAAVSALWEPVRPFAVALEYEAGARTFYPVTDKAGQNILFKVEPTSFDPAFALLSYLTLEFQFLHEYVSHALPVWVNGTQEEVLLLAATYRFYPSSLPFDGIRSFLADALRQRRPDEYSTARDRVLNFAAQMGQEQFSRFVLSLAITEDELVSKTEKANLTSKLKMLPLSDHSLQQRCNVHLKSSEPGPEDFRALRQLIPAKH